MVDQEHAGVVLVADGSDHVRELRHLGLGQPRSRLVEEDEPRLGRERARDPEPPLVAVRERARWRLGAPGQPDELEQLGRPAPRGAGARAPIPSAATSTFSRTLRSRNERLCWNVRARPERPRRCALHLVTSRSSSSIVPAVGVSKPLMRLTSVDLPAPFGPIRPDDLVPVQRRA